MGRVTVEYADVTVSGHVEGLWRDTVRPEQRFRFKAADGQLSVVVPDAVPNGLGVQVGDEVEVACMPSVVTFGKSSELRLVAVSLRRVDKKTGEIK